MDDILITVLTPTYNRGQLLVNAFNSLLRQTSHNFEWIVVDDGSIDNTCNIVNSFSTDLFKIKYIKKENGGKHTAINYGVCFASGYLTLILDSDDFLSNDCIEFIEKHVDEIRHEDFAGLSGLRGYANSNTPIGMCGGNKKYIDATNIQRRRKKLLGDKAEAYKTDILKKFPFPVYDGEVFLSENAVWDQIALAGYKLRWFNKIIYYGEYLDGGLTKNLGDDVFLKNFNGYTYCFCVALKWEKGLRRLWLIANYQRIARKKGFLDKELIKLINVNYCELLISRVLLKVRSAIKG